MKASTTARLTTGLSVAAVVAVVAACGGAKSTEIEGPAPTGATSDGGSSGGSSSSSGGTVDGGTIVDGGGPLDAGPACKSAGSVSLDFASGQTPGGWNEDKTGGSSLDYDNGELVATADLGSGGGGGARARITRSVQVEAGVSRFELAFDLTTDAPEPGVAAEVGCSLVLTPTPGQPASDRRFLVRADAPPNGERMRAQYSQGQPVELADGFGAKKRIRVVGALDAAGTTITGSVSIDGASSPLGTPIAGPPKVVRLECGVPNAFAQAGAVLATQTANVDNVQLSLCAR